MFPTKKTKKLLEQTEEKLREIRKEKEELELLKKLLEDTTPKVDISNLYVLQKNNSFFIVEKIEKRRTGRLVYFHKDVPCFETNLVDIFTKKIIYHECSLDRICLYPYLKPILSVEHSLMVFPDQKVPFYLLQQLYYKLNNISLSDSEYVKKLNYNFQKK